ncbi:MAG: AAA family ATPase, partial [Bacteroidales bacterium]
MTDYQEFENRIDLSGFAEKINEVRNEIKKIIVGQEKVTDLLLIALLSDGHVLIEGVPGVAKTLMANLLAKTINTSFQRIQFTPDLMPSDITGTSIYNEHKAEFEFKKGPVFANIILIDEINRSPAKTQSALFEVMEEQKISIEGKTFEMSYPFFVIGTQNPIEHEGTYRLAEAQKDRFIFRIKIEFPSLENETNILRTFNGEDYKEKLQQIQPVLSTGDLRYIRQQVNDIHVEDQLFGYISQIIHETR